MGDSNHFDSVWLHYGALICAKSDHGWSLGALAGPLLGAFGISWRGEPCDRLWIICPQEGWVMSRSTWLLARAIWISFAIVFLVFFGLELVFRVLDEAKLPHANYTAEGN